MSQVAVPVACFQFARAQLSEVLSQRITDQRRTIDPRLLGRPIRGTEKRRIKHHLNSLHGVDVIPTVNHSLTGSIHHA